MSLLLTLQLLSFQPSPRQPGSLPLLTPLYRSRATALVGWSTGFGYHVEPVALFLCDLAARDRSAGSIRSYALALLRWWRFLLCTCQASGCE